MEKQENYFADIIRCEFFKQIWSGKKFWQKIVSVKIFCTKIHWMKTVNYGMQSMSMAISTSGFDDVENIYEFHKRCRAGNPITSLDRKVFQIVLHLLMVWDYYLFPCGWERNQTVDNGPIHIHACTDTPKFYSLILQNFLCITVLRKTIFLMCNCSTMPITGLHLFERVWWGDYETSICEGLKWSKSVMLWAGMNLIVTFILRSSRCT